MEISSDIRIREYAKEDYPVLRGWWQAHDAEPMPEQIIPQSSCVVEDEEGAAAFGAVFLCNANHVAFFHGMVTRPGMCMKHSYRMLKALQDGIDIIMASGGHTILFGTVQPGAMLRGAKRLGFNWSDNNYHQVNRIITTELTN